MGRWSRWAMAATLVVSAASTVLRVPAHADAAATPPLPASLGTVAVAVTGGRPSSTTLTFSGSIAVGGGVFSGTASGAYQDFGVLPAARNPIPPFTLSGQGLSGTCSGLWQLDPTTVENFGLSDPVGVLLNLPPNPVNVVSLACTLQLGAAPPAQTSLTLAVISDDAPADTHFTGVYGPGLGSVPLPVLSSHGVVDRSFVFSSSSTTQYDLVGDIALGGRVFEGDARGSYVGSPSSVPFPLTGSSASGDLAATCTDAVPLDPLGQLAGTSQVDILFATLSCRGQIGGGPVGTTTLMLLTPLDSGHFEDGCGHCTSEDTTGVFIGT